MRRSPREPKSILRLPLVKESSYLKNKNKSTQLGPPPPRGRSRVSAQQSPTPSRWKDVYIQTEFAQLLHLLTVYSPLQCAQSL